MAFNFKLNQGKEENEKSVPGFTFTGRALFVVHYISEVWLRIGMCIVIEVLSILQ